MIKRIALGVLAAGSVGVGVMHTEVVGGIRFAQQLVRSRFQTTCAQQAMTGTSPQLLRLPTRYLADRFMAVPVTTQGDTIPLFIDSGGGGVFVTKQTLEELGASPKFMVVDEGDSVFTGDKFPTFKADASIPAPLCNGGQFDFGFGTGSTMKEMEGAAGMLGHDWFAQRVWVFDYPAKTLSVYDSPPPPIPFGPHTIPMTLKDPPKRNDPRIQVTVAGESIDMLLDIGATSVLTPAAVATMGGDAITRGSAFVATRLWDHWRAAHPEWRVLAGGEANMNADLIEVPSLVIGGYTVGPVWFAKRPNGVYDGMMAALMDKPIQASIGGAAFRTLRITMDYANQRATFAQ